MQPWRLFKFEGFAGKVLKIETGFSSTDTRSTRVQDESTKVGFWKRFVLIFFGNDFFFTNGGSGGVEIGNTRSLGLERIFPSSLPSCSERIFGPTRCSLLQYPRCKQISQIWYIREKVASCTLFVCTFLLFAWKKT